MFISPSLASADVLNLRAEMCFAQEHFSHVHLDIEDGVYLHNISFGFKIASQISQSTTAYTSMHLMLHDPLAWIAEVKACAADVVFVHVEHTSNPVAVLQAYKAAGISVGLGLSDRDMGHDITQLLQQVREVLVLTARIEDPLQQYDSELGTFVRMLSNGSHQVWVDGGITLEQLPSLQAMGVAGAVLGRAVFNHKQQVSQLKQFCGETSTPNTTN